MHNAFKRRLKHQIGVGLDYSQWRSLARYNLGHGPPAQKIVCDNPLVVGPYKLDIHWSGRPLSSAIDLQLLCGNVVTINCYNFELA